MCFGLIVTTVGTACSLVHVVNSCFAWTRLEMPKKTTPASDSATTDPRSLTWRSVFGDFTSDLLAMGFSKSDKFVGLLSVVAAMNQTEYDRDKKERGKGCTDQTA